MPIDKWRDNKKSDTCYSVMKKNNILSFSENGRNYRHYFNRMVMRLQPHSDMCAVHKWNHCWWSTPLHFGLSTWKANSTHLYNLGGSSALDVSPFLHLQDGKNHNRTWTLLWIFPSETPLICVTSQFQADQDVYYAQLAKHNSFFPGDEEHILRNVHTGSTLSEERICLQVSDSLTPAAFTKSVLDIWMNVFWLLAFPCLNIP